MGYNDRPMTIATRRPARNAAPPRAEPARAPLDRGVLRGSLGYLLRLADVESLQRFSRVFDGTGVTPARLTALELVARNPGVKPAALAAAMAVERSNLVSLLRPLRERGWIGVEAGANGREKALRATPAGTRALAGLRRRLARHDALLAQRLSADERATLAALLARLVVDGRDEQPLRGGARRDATSLSFDARRAAGAPRPPCPGSSPSSPSPDR
jgi:DNA-binding MarR family transcriptional regulator